MGIWYRGITPSSTDYAPTGPRFGEWALLEQPHGDSRSIRDVPRSCLAAFFLVILLLVVWVDRKLVTKGQVDHHIFTMAFLNSWSPISVMQLLKMWKCNASGHLF